VAGVARVAYSGPVDSLTSYSDLFGRVALSLLVLVLTWVAMRLTRRAADRYLARQRANRLDPSAATKLRMIERLISASLLFLGLGIAFYVLDFASLRKLAVGMFASAGVMGIVLGLAAQTTAANLVSGVLIAFVQPLRLGDRVSMGNDFGVVEQIGLFYTTLCTWDNRRLVIPNKVLTNEVIRNYTVVDASMPAAVVFRLKHGADVDRARVVLIQEATKLPQTLPDPAVTTTVRDADETGLSLQLVAWASAEQGAWELAQALGERGMYRLAAEGIPSTGYRQQIPDPDLWMGARS
jgi:small conductance mechanosensitive channel